MNRPRLAVEVMDSKTHEILYTHYFNITNTKEIADKITSITTVSDVIVSRFYYANDCGIEIDFEEVKA